MVLEVPALKDRVADLPVLTTALLDRAQHSAGIEKRPISDEALSELSRHPWPGNVRALENAVRVAALFAKGDRIELGDFVDNVEGLRQLTADAPANGPGATAPWLTLRCPASR